jgi:hypothetical protein
MCTVTFFPNRDKIFLTSNRDENQFRSPAVPPQVYEMQTGKILFPKDSDAGGTWISLHENGNAVVFLNGGFTKHTPQPSYRKSRGLVLLQLSDSFSPKDSFIKIELSNIEPFTAVIWDNEKLFECRWDGKDRHTKELDPGAPHIWSSVTLYDPKVISKRRAWFDGWLKKNPDPGMNEILFFHQFTGDGDKHNDLLMNRNGNVFTVSITGMELSHHKGKMHYVDLSTRQTFSRQIDFCKAIPVH